MRAIRFAAIWLAARACATDAAPLFVEVTAEAGVGYSHRDLEDDTLVCSGTGAGWADFDGDGDPDLYATSQDGPNHLFRNDGGTFTDIAADVQLDLPDDPSTAVLWGDYDNDGDPDLFVGAVGADHFFRNDGPDGNVPWTFTEVTTQTGLSGPGRTSSAAWGDYDNDGWLDMYVSNYIIEGGQWPQQPDPGLADNLYHNVAGPDGRRVFVDVASDVFGLDVLSLGIAHSGGFLDMDNDSDLDLVMVNEVFLGVLESNGVQVWRNDGSEGESWRFTEVSAEVGVDLPRDHPMGMAVGDYNADGWLDFALSDVGPTHLFRNDGGTFTKLGTDVGVGREKIPGTTYDEVGWGLAFADFDRDGQADLFVASGYCNQVDKAYQPDALFLGVAGTRFLEAAPDYGAYDPGRSHGVALADYDGDGDMDLFVLQYSQDSHLYENVSPPGNYLTLRLVGTRSNRDAIGARVEVVADAWPLQEAVVLTGPSHGNTHSLDQVFAVGSNATIDAVSIDWPSGRQTDLTDVAVNHVLVVGEPGLLISGAARIAPGSRSAFSAMRYFEDGRSEDVTGQVEWTLDTSEQEQISVDPSGQVAVTSDAADQYAMLHARMDAEQADLLVLVQKAVAAAPEEPDPTDDEPTSDDESDDAPGPLVPPAPPTNAGPPPSPGGGDADASGDSADDADDTALPAGPAEVDESTDADTGGAAADGADPSPSNDGAAGGGGGGRRGGACGTPGLIGLLALPAALFFLRLARTRTVSGTD